MWPKRLPEKGNLDIFNTRLTCQQIIRIIHTYQFRSKEIGGLFKENRGKKINKINYK